MFRKLFGQKNDTKLLSELNYAELFIAGEIDGIETELLDIGKLSIPSGKIIAADPLVYLSDSIPFNRNIKPGEYDVIVSVARSAEMGERYAAVMTRFTDTDAVRWEMALTDRNNVSELKHEGDYFGFPVDAGLGCFCDVETQKLFNEFVDSFYAKSPEANIYDDFFASLFKKNAREQDNPEDIGDWLNFSIPGHPAHNIIMFHSGFGDGSYPCYWGIDAKGKINSLVADFLIFGT
jgi:hypothetical protein